MGGGCQFQFLPMGIWAQSGHSVDGRNPLRHHLKKPKNVSSPVNTNKQWFVMVSEVVQDFVPPTVVDAAYLFMLLALPPG